MIQLVWHNEQRKVKDLIPFEYNPRILTEDRKKLLQASLEKFGLVEIPAINTDGKIIAGHQRVKVLMDLGRGEELIDVRVPNRDLTEDEFKEYNLRSNIQIGFWDKDILEEAFANIDLGAIGLNLDSIPIPGQEPLVHIEPVIEISEVPEPSQKPALVKLGDIFHLGNHVLMCGDSTKTEDVSALMSGELCDMVVTDPPYNVNYEGERGMKIENDKMDSNSFYTFLLQFYANAISFMKNGAAIYVFHADTEGMNFRKAFVDAGLKLSQCLVWVKNSFVMGRQDYHWKHEPILYGWKLGEGHTWLNDRKQSTVLQFNRPMKNEEHPTIKPTDIICYLIQNNCSEKSTVMDLFGGSGSTLISCEQTNRKCKTMEFSPSYAEVIIRRYHNYMVQQNSPTNFKHTNGNLNLNDILANG